MVISPKVRAGIEARVGGIWTKSKEGAEVTGEEAAGGELGEELQLINKKRRAK
jgi:hypothetical protein